MSNLQKFASMVRTGRQDVENADVEIARLIEEHKAGASMSQTVSDIKDVCFGELMKDVNASFAASHEFKFNMGLSRGKPTRELAARLRNAIVPNLEDNIAPPDSTRKKELTVAEIIEVSLLYEILFQNADVAELYVAATILGSR